MAGGGEPHRLGLHDVLPAQPSSTRSTHRGDDMTGATMPSATLARLGKLLPLLGSPEPGEVTATAAAIGRTLKAAGLDWHALATHVATAQPPPFTFKGMMPRAARKLIPVMMARGRMTPLQLGRCEAFRAWLFDGRKGLEPVSAENAAWLDVLWLESLGGGA